MAGIPSKTEPLVAVGALAETAANQRGASLVGSPLRLFDGVTRADLAAVDVAAAGLAVASGVQPGEPGGDGEPHISAFALGRTYELLLAPTTRRKTGSHLTPELVARRLVAMMNDPQPDARVLDPAVGGAAFLLASLDQLVAVGADPTQALHQVAGIDIDPGAVAVAEAALAIWSLDAGCDVQPLPAIRHGDGLLDELPASDRVVGNPPFLNQLKRSSSHTAKRRAALRERWGELVSTYTDDAWLFFAASLQALTTGGQLALVQPVSLLSARHAEEIRRFTHDRAAMTGLWVGRDRVFDAAVQVCGIVLERSTPPKRRPLTRAVGADFDRVDSLPTGPLPHEWGTAAATAVGVPHVQINNRNRVVSDLAHATAGFRDQFYGFVPYVSESDGGGELADGFAKLVTVGMIDPFTLDWGKRQFKFAKREVHRPVVDLQALRAGDPKLALWTDARLRPKLLIATQTRVVEVWVDERGNAVPATPVLSVEPNDNDQDTLWLLAAALSAPAISALTLATKFGTAMALNSMKLAARDVLAMPLPVDLSPWQSAAALIRRAAPGLTAADAAEFARLMGLAYRTADSDLAQWWQGRMATA